VIRTTLPVHELAPLRARHTVVPFDRRLDDQRTRARRLALGLSRSGAAPRG
jgi:hypothetical protein